MLSFSLLNTNVIRKKLVLFLVKRLIGNYINKSIPIDDIELNTNGFKIKYIDIDSDVLQLFSDFTHINDSHIEDLEIYIPWTNLFSQSSKLHIGKITIDMDWVYCEDIDINNIAQSILHKSLNIHTVEDYLHKSIIEDKEFILKESNTDEGIGILTNTINQFIENIEITIDVIDVKLNFPDIEQTISCEIYNFEVVKIPTDEIDEEITKPNKLLDRRINVDEIVFFINKKTILSIHDFQVNLDTNITVNEYSKYHNELTIYTIDTTIRFIHTYVSLEILSMLFPVIKLLKKCFVSKTNVDPAKSYQININLLINKLDFILETN